MPDTFNRTIEFIKNNPGLRVEVIVVDNASTDRTREIAASFSSEYPFVRYFSESIRGKGAAVRKGILAGLGDYLLISDADLAVPLEEIRKFLPPRIADYDIAIGSREVEGAKRYDEPAYRHLMGRVFNALVRLLVLPGIRDTQCGFKCFRREIGRELFCNNRISGWSFDVEILAIAKLRGYRIVEVPVQWYYGERSKVNPVKDTFDMFKEVLMIWQNKKRGIYKN